MSTASCQGKPLWSRGMAAVLVAQFLSAMADNALLFGTLALLKLERYPDWTDPLLQEFFVGPYILLAPFSGPLADALPKGRVMLISNALKLTGALGIVAGLDPFLCYGLVGVGAATYTPAKYGILSELTSADQLVKANSLIESSTIAAILIGAVTGGMLADLSVRGALCAVTACYALAAIANLFIPRLPPAHQLASVSFTGMLRDFAQATATLFRVDEARFSIIGTSIFWGAGSTMRFLLIAWVPVALGITSNRMPALLNAIVAIGIVLGAALAGKLIPLERAAHALWGGILLGIAVCLLSVTSNLAGAVCILGIVGAAGGIFVVPLNALLQERGGRSVGSGHAIAIQNLAENTSMLLMIGLYISIMRSGASVSAVAAGFGTLLSLGIAALGWHQLRQRRAAACLGGESW